MYFVRFGLILRKMAIELQNEWLAGLWASAVLTIIAHRWHQPYPKPSKYGIFEFRTIVGCVTLSLSHTL